MNDYKYKLLEKIIDNNEEIDLLKNPDIEIVKELQLLLNEKGFNVGDVDGIIGRGTTSGLAKAKKYFYLGEPNKIGATTLNKLFKMQPIRGLFLPTDGIGWMSSPFGKRGSGFHRGIDIAANEGTPVYAIAEGIITVTQSNCSIGNFSCGGGYGNCIYIRHSKYKGFNESRYAHLSKVFVTIEQSISKGMIIGKIGNTGHSFGNHLHFELRKDNVAVNPINIINPIV